MDWKLVGSWYLGALATFLIFVGSFLRAGWIFDKNGNVSWGVIGLIIIIFVTLLIGSTCGISHQLKNASGKKPDVIAEEIGEQVKLSEENIIKELKSLLQKQAQEKSVSISEEQLEKAAKDYYEALNSKNVNFIYQKGYEELGEISFWFTPGWPKEASPRKFYLVDLGSSFEKNRISLYVNDKKQLVLRILTSDGRKEYLTADISSWQKGQAYFIVIGWNVAKDGAYLMINQKKVSEKSIPNLHFDTLGTVVLRGIDFEGRFPAKLGEGFPVPHKKTDDILKEIGVELKEYKKE
jgi:hypothetical protein